MKINYIEYLAEYWNTNFVFQHSFLSRRKMDSWSGVLRVSGRLLDCLHSSFQKQLSVLLTKNYGHTLRNCKKPTPLISGKILYWKWDHYGGSLWFKLELQGCQSVKEEIVCKRDMILHCVPCSILSQWKNLSTVVICEFLGERVIARDSEFEFVGIVWVGDRMWVIQWLK